MILALMKRKGTTHGASSDPSAKEPSPIAEVSMNYAVRLMHTLRWVGIAGVILAGTSARGEQSEFANPAAREALVLCRAADGVPLSERAKILASGLARAERAVQEAPQDADAHFAVFCNLGKRLQIEQHTLWLLSGLNELNRARRELDVALELAPDYPAAVAAKGEMLAELPRFLGGDAREGERLLRRAVGLAPDDPHIRVMLASLLRATGQPEEARMHAAVALHSEHRRSSELTP